MTAPDRVVTDVDALKWAIERLDSEEHRYVERFTACPNGCVFDPRPGGEWVRTAGTNTAPDGARDEGCDVCFYGSYEDDDAPHIDPELAALRALLARIDEPVTTARCRWCRVQTGLPHAPDCRHAGHRVGDKVQ